MKTTIISAKAKQMLASLKIARGTYQRSLLEGSARWSGADLKGTAAKYGVHYAHSRKNLIKRLKDVFEIEFASGPHGLKILYILTKQEVEEINSKSLEGGNTFECL